MTDESDVRRSFGRSPPFPFITLEKSVVRLQEFSEYSRGHASRLLSAVTGAWGYNPKSSGGLQTVAALKAWGLIVDTGSGDDRRIQVSELGKRLLRSPPASVKRSLLQEAALKPRVMAEVWKVWGAYRPPDEDCIWALTDGRGFTQEAAVKALAIYDAAIRFAELSRPDSPTSTVEDIDGDGEVESDVDGVVVQEARVEHSPPRNSYGGDASIRADRPGRWIERLRDRAGIEISVDFSQEPTAETYAYLRDYIAFKLGGMPAVVEKVNKSTESAEIEMFLTTEQKNKLQAHGFTMENINNMGIVTALRTLDLLG